ncbi:MAG: DinB family protein [Candidatus Thorarchaeota archaeon]|nr:DinB family protein [Candidatus Thorarchaeota archaeon]
MIYKILTESVKRHLKETLPLIEQLTEINVLSRPIEGGREIGEVVLHLVRSLEYYTKGITTNQWEALPYYIETYDSAESIIELAKNVFETVKVYTSLVSPTDLGRSINSFNSPATVAHLILEMLEHSIHHRGQITTYYRLLGISPVSIPYIV